MILYDYFRSSAAYRVRIALNLKGMVVDHQFVHLRKGEARSVEYLAINPQGLLPSFMMDHTVLRQSLSIIEYLDETNPEHPLLPTDPLGRARVRSLAQTIACDIHPLNNLRVLSHLRKAFALDAEGVNQWCRLWIEEGFDALEDLLIHESPAGGFCHGDQPTLADVCLIPQVFSAERFKCDLGKWPTITAIADRCRSLDAFARAEPGRQPDAE